MNLKKMTALLSTVVLLAAGAAAIAQEATKPEEKATVKPEEKPTEVGGRIYMWYSRDMANKSTTLPREPKTDHFELNRAYITVAREFSDVFSAKLVTDVKPDASAQYIYIKNAFVQMRLFKDGPVTWTTRFGVVGTPVIELVDKVSDARWIYQNYIDKSKDVLNGTSVDNSADMGLLTELDIVKIVKLTGGYMNAEGYSARLVESNYDKSKRLFGMVTLTPIKQLVLSGFYKTDLEMVSTTVSTNPTSTVYPYNDQSKLSYWGALIAWSDKSFKIGASYSIPYKSSIKYCLASGAQVGIYGQRTRWYGRIFDSWVHVNLKELTGLGFILYGRYAHGIDDVRTRYITRSSSNYLKPKFDPRTDIWAAGLGYQFNKNVRLLAMYEVNNVNNDSRTRVLPDGTNATEIIPMERTLWVKTEASF